MTALLLAATFLSGVLSGVVLFVVLACCHASGTAARAEERRRRPLDDLDPRERPR